MTQPRMAPARQKLLDAALAVIREKGYVATTVDESLRACRCGEGFVLPSL